MCSECECFQGKNFMKIGILSFWWSNDNYGQLLQKYLRDMGHEPFLIRYDYTKDIKRTPLFFRLLKACNPFLLFKYFINKKKSSKVQDEQKENDRYFDDFRKKYIPFSEIIYNSFEELKNNSPVADAYIVGSDQVWNYWNMRLWRYINPLHAYFLDFGSDKTKRLSYAASWGRTELSQEFKKEISPLLSKFDYISVREQSGVDLCSQCGRNDTEWVCDPTLLLTAEKYRELYKNEDIRKPNNKYLLLYLLNNKFDFDKQKVYEFAKSKELEVVYITGNGMLDEYKKYFATIPEWLYLVDNAEYVVTNSFHCGVFSTIFNKKFGIVPLCGSDDGMNARFDSLFELRACGNRYLTEEDFSVLACDYLAKNIVVSEKFIKAISGNE